MTPTVLIVLPGWGGTHETWQDFMAAVRPFCEVVCIDLPCFGDAPCPPTAWGVDEYATYVTQKIQELAASVGVGKRIVLLGHSFGGQVATVVTARRGVPIDALILSGAAVIRPKRFFRRIFFWIIARCGRVLFRLPLLERFDLLAKKILYRSSHSPDFSDTSGIKREIFRRIVRQDVSSLLPSILVPSLVVWGEHDSYIPLRHGKKIAKLLPHATLRVYPNAGHGLHLKHIPVLVNDIEIFLQHL